MDNPEDLVRTLEGTVAVRTILTFVFRVTFQILVCHAYAAGARTLCTVHAVSLSLHNLRACLTVIGTR